MAQSPSQFSSDKTYNAMATDNVSLVAVALQTDSHWQPPINITDEEIAARYRRHEETPTGDNLLGPFSVVCLVLNRTIGRFLLLLLPRPRSPMCWCWWSFVC